MRNEGIIYRAIPGILALLAAATVAYSVNTYVSYSNPKLNTKTEEVRKSPEGLANIFADFVTSRRGNE